MYCDFYYAFLKIFLKNVINNESTLQGVKIYIIFESFYGVNKARKRLITS